MGPDGFILSTETLQSFVSVAGVPLSLHASPDGVILSTESLQSFVSVAGAPLSLYAIFMRGVLSVFDTDCVNLVKFCKKRKWMNQNGILQ